MLPRSGGIEVYLEYTYQRPYLLAIGLLTGIMLLHGRFYRTDLWVQNVLGWLKLALVAVMIVSRVLVVLVKADTNNEHHQQAIWRQPTSNSSSNSGHSDGDGLWAGSEWSYSFSATTLVNIYYSYAGLDNMNAVLGEVLQPVRTLKRVAPAALLTGCLLYVLLNAAYMAVVPLEQIKHSRELVAGLFFQHVFGDRVGRRLLPIAIALSATGNVMVVTFSIARIEQEIVRSGILPFTSLLGSYNKSLGTPLGGLVVHYVPSLLVIAISSSSTVYGFIAAVEGYAAQFFALALAIGLLYLRRRDPFQARPFRAWNSVVYFRIIFSLALALAPFCSQSKGQSYAYVCVALGSITISFLYWLVWTRVLPYYGGYRLEEEKTGSLDDGTAVTTFVRKPEIAT